jgi:RIO kinase 1
VGQAVLTDHVNARDFLNRDIENINRFFKGLEVKIMDREEVLKQVTGAST